MDLKVSLPKINQYTLPFQKSPNTKPANLEKTPQADSFEMSIGYVNDIHGQTNNMMRILSGIKGDLRLSAGDNDIGDEKNKTVHKATTKFLNIANIKASALGNHEFDTKQNDFIQTVKDFDGAILTANFKKDALSVQSTEEIETQGRADLDNYIKKSSIVEVKGEKIGLVGASPVDMFERATHPDYHKDCHVDSLDETIEDIQEEVDELKEQGINKIVLLSHLGHKRDRVVAQNTSGIDVIVGGHTHELVKDIKEGENLFYSKDGEPVIITEAGRDGRAFGLLNLTFDKNGVITDYEVLEHKETPGLGANIESWFKSEDPKRSIKGKNPVECKMVVSKDGGDIDAITASTISSRAFLEAVRNAYEVFCKKNNINSCKDMIFLSIIIAPSDELISFPAIIT